MSEYTTPELIALVRQAKYFQYNAVSRTDLPEIVAKRLEESQAELDAYKRTQDAMDANFEVLADQRDALWALLSEHRDFPNAGDAEAFRQWHKDWCARRDAAPFATSISAARRGEDMKLTARSRLEPWANVSRTQSDEETHGLCGRDCMRAYQDRSRAEE